MNLTLFRLVFSSLGVAALTVVGGGFAAQAESLDQPAAAGPEAIQELAASEDYELIGILQVEDQDAVIHTSADVLGEPVNGPLAQAQTPAPADDTTIAQVISPGTATRSGPSYIGVGGNIGFGGNTVISDGSYAIFSKIGITNNLSVRPAALISGDVVILVPLTIDFTTQAVPGAPLTVAPYVGGGVAISTGDDSDVGLLLSAGLDVPVSPQFTATAGVNVGFIDGTDVGLLVGIGYNF